MLYLMKNREEQGLENNWNRNYLKSVSNFWLLEKVQFLKRILRVKLTRKLVKKKYQQNDDKFKRTMSIP